MPPQEQACTIGNQNDVSRALGAGGAVVYGVGAVRKELLQKHPHLWYPHLCSCLNKASVYPDLLSMFPQCFCFNKRALDSQEKNHRSF